MKNNKGITMISLAIVIILMILIASITVYESNGVISIARVQSVTTDLLLIQAKVRIINEKIVFESDNEQKETLKLGEKLSLSEHYYKREELFNTGVVSTDFMDNDDEAGKYYILSQGDLNEMGLETLKADDGYIVNYEDETVIFLKGVKDANKKYLYKLQGDILI